MSFASDIEKFAEKTELSMNMIKRRSAMEVYRRVVLRSPVGAPWTWKKPRKGYVGGRFRANWLASVGIPRSSTVESRGQGESQGSIANAVAAAKGDEAIFLTNNLPYAVPLEDGWSKQAPNGMVGLVAAEWEGIVEETARGS